MTDGKLKVLIVEDDAFMASLLAEGFAKAGFDVAAARTGDEAVKQFAEAKPDAILLDVLLPGKSGLDALREIRALPGGAGIPVLVLSNIEEAGYIRQAEALGVKSYLIKANLQVAEIVAKVREAIGR